MDRARAQADLDQLPVADDPVLPTRQLGHRPCTWSILIPHSGTEMLHVPEIRPPRYD
jgi:hypothetical protein